MKDVEKLTKYNQYYVIYYNLAKYIYVFFVLMV